MKEISSIRLIYDKMKESDFLFFSHLYADPRVMQYTYLDVCDAKRAKEIFLEVFEEKVFTYYSVREKGSGQYIGFVFYNTTLEHTEGGIISIGYLLYPEFWGQGYATEMGKAMLDHLFSTRSIHKVEANLHAENHASEKVLKKIGMTKEGVTRKSRYKDGKWVDEIHYGILREEYSMHVTHIDSV